MRPEGAMKRHERVHRFLQCIHWRSVRLDQRDRAGRGLQCRKLVRCVGFADRISAGGHLGQRQARQGLKRRMGREHLAAFAPCGVENDQSQAVGRGAACRRSDVDDVRRALWRLRIQERSARRSAFVAAAPRAEQRGRQCILFKRVAHQQTAFGQTEMQQSACALRMSGFFGMHQHQHLRAFQMHAPHCCADAGARGSKADGAVRATSRRGLRISCRARVGCCRAGCHAKVG